MIDFVQFTGEETEKEFLEKCLEQWELSAEKPPIMAMIQLGSLFSEMRHRFDELEDEALRGWVPGGGEVD